MTRTHAMLGLSLVLVVSPGATAAAADLYDHGGWPALATDRTAHKPGDVLMVLVFESSAATDTASSGSSRDSRIGGNLSVGTTFDKSASLSLDGGSGDTGTIGRSGGMVAQISATVESVFPNGDLLVEGAQVMNINGEETKIQVKGRVRLADISPSNTVLSSRLADAAIAYDGSGFVTRSSQVGLVTRVFNWLGIP
ncbi:MAG: flagellar basal body L-ring protein FlgH [Rhizomicrobium sp.]